MTAFINRIATALPAHDVHSAFVGFAGKLLPERSHALFRRMAERSGIEHRWSAFQPNDGEGESIDAEGFYTLGHFPGTAARMRRYETDALDLAIRAAEGLAGELSGVTHLVAVSCTGMVAPGIDLALIEHFGLDPAVERTCVGFMGCQAAINGLKLADHIVRSDPGARVLLVCVELCSLHLQESADLEQVLCFLLFGDGCAAALISAEKQGVAIEGFRSTRVPDTGGHITWAIRDSGFDMHLSGQVPAVLGHALRAHRAALLPNHPVALWAVHPGGRTVLDAVQDGLDLEPEALAASRSVLRDCGNMSSPTVLFVLDRLTRDAPSGEPGCALAFGPGLSAETMRFRTL